MGITNNLVKSCVVSYNYRKPPGHMAALAYDIV